MSQPEQKPCIQKRIRTWLFNVTPENRFLIAVIMGNVFVYFAFLIYGIYVSYTTFLSYLTSWSAGVLGIYFGFALDRKLEQIKDNRVKRDFLNLVHDELIEIKNAIYPQTKNILLFYTDIWDSIISSGVIRLFSSEQVTKLSKVYKYAKGHLFEAEWVRRAVEEFNSVPEAEQERRKWLENRYKGLWFRHFERGKQLSESIENILKEKWWN